MTEDSNPPPSSGSLSPSTRELDTLDPGAPSSEPPPSRAHKRALARIEARVITMETQVLALQNRVTEVNGILRAQRHRALWLRVFLLAAALAAFFFIRSMKGTG